MSARTAAVLVAILLVGCDDVDGDCRIGVVGGTNLSERDVVALRSRMSPPPTKEEAARLLVDAWVVWRVQAPPEAATPSPDDLLVAYQQFWKSIRAEVGGASRSWHEPAAAKMKAMHAQAGVELGPCYPAHGAPLASTTSSRKR